MADRKAILSWCLYDWANSAYPTVVTTFIFGAYFTKLVAVDPESGTAAWGWGLGYVGGLLCLVIALLGFVQTDTPLFGVSTEASGNIRAVTLLAAAWFALFALPLFLFTPDRPAVKLGVWRALGEGFAALGETLREIRNYAQILRFLLARMFYADGLVTLFAMGGIYAVGTFGMTLGEVVQFGIALNVSAGLGAFAFAWLDDRIGAKPVIVIALVALMLLGGGALLVTSKTAFWAIGTALGLFVGPAQSASRSLMARLSPEVMRTEMFGLYAMSGKATAFMGPLAFGLATDIFDSQRAGMATILVFFVIGLFILLPVREPRQ